MPLWRFIKHVERFIKHVERFMMQDERFIIDDDRFIMHDNRIVKHDERFIMPHARFIMHVWEDNKLVLCFITSVLRFDMPVWYCVLLYLLCDEC